MSQAKAERPDFSFNKGINSDASPLTFPPNFSTDEQNYELMLDGTRRRRRGLEAETDTVLSATQPEGAGVRTFKWRAVGGDPDLNFHCVQVGSFMYFMDDTSTPSDNVRNFTIDLTTLAVEGFSSVAGDYLVDMAFGRGQAIIVGQYLEPHSISYDVDTDNIITTPITIRERDFQGVEDGFDNQTKSGTLFDPYQYNLVNQGWIYGDILTFHAEQGSYPSKNMIPWFGYRRATVTGFDPNDGTKQFSSDKLVAEIFQDAPAPRGHFIRNPFDTNATLVVETETVKNYVSLIKPSGHAHFDQLAPPGIPSQENGPNFMNLPGTTLLTFKFDSPHFLSVGNVVNFFTEAAGKIGSNSGDGNRLWEIKGNHTVEAVIDGNTISFYNTIVDDAAGWRSTWPFSYWPTMYAFVGGDTVTIEGTIIDERPTAVTFFAGRAIYAGVPHPTLGSALFVSQVVEVDAQYGKCYQVADPTSDKISDLVDTDGLVIRIPELGRVYRLIPNGASCIVYASNGVWQVGPGAAGYFTATSYSIRKLSDVQVVNATSVMQAEGVPCLWASSGIFVIVEDPNNGFLVVRSITEQKIDTLYAGLGEAVRKTATGDFDPVNKRACWIYVEDGEYFALVYDLRFQAFTKWKFEAPVSDMFTVTDLNSATSTLRFICFTSNEFVVASATSVEFEDFGVATEAFMVTGFDTAQSPARRKQAPLVTVFSKRTEQVIPGTSVDIPDSMLIAVSTSGVDGTHQAMRSVDGAIFTLLETPLNTNSPASGFIWQGLAHSPELNLIVAVASDLSQPIMRSSDGGLSWTLAFGPVSGVGCTSIAWSPTLRLFAATLSSATTAIITSPDGETWTPRSTPSFLAPTSIVWCEGAGGRFVAGQITNGTDAVITSDNGATWVARTTVATNPIYELATTGVHVVGVNRGDTKVIRSADGGITWASQATGAGFGLGDAAFDPVSLKSVAVSTLGVAISAALAGYTAIGAPLTVQWEGACYSTAFGGFYISNTPGATVNLRVAKMPDGQNTLVGITTDTTLDAGTWKKILAIDVVASEPTFATINESSTIMQARWDWADNTVAGKWGSERQVYRKRRMFVPEDEVSDELQDGQPVIVTRNKVRGRGRCFQLKFSAEPGKDSHILGWATNFNVYTDT